MLDHTSIGKTASFKLRASAIIVTDYTDVTILAIGNHEVVPFIDPAALHASIYPTIAQYAPNDYRMYDYIIVRLANGTVTAVGEPWIDPVTLKISSRTDVELRVTNADATDAAKIKTILASHGYFDVTAKVLMK